MNKGRCGAIEALTGFAALTRSRPLFLGCRRAWGYGRRRADCGGSLYWTFRMWDALRLDVRHSFRNLRRAPTFSVIVIVTLTVAVGATTAVGSLLNALVLRTIAVPSPEQLVALSALDPRTNVSGYFYEETFKAYRSAQRSFAQMSMYSGGGLARVEMRSAVFDAVTETVSPTYFDMVGARPSAGRFFTESDDAVAVISESFRRRIFGDGRGVGEVVNINGVPATLIGVTAEGFEGLRAGGLFDIIMPFALMRSATDGPSRPIRSSGVVGRLARGVSVDAARAELLARWPSIQSATQPSTLPEPERQALLRQRLDVAPLATGYWALSSRYGTTLVVLLGLMTMLLAVACANLAGLALARSLTRRHQVAVRLALGGGAVVFRPILQDMARSQFPMAYVRASGDLATVRDGYTRVVTALGHRSLRSFMTSSEFVDSALLRERFTTALATFAAALTSLLGCMGVYGLLAYSVTARIREIGCAWRLAPRAGRSSG